MSAGGTELEWVESAEEVVVVTEESLPSEDDTLTVNQLSEAPAPELLDTLSQGGNPEANDGFYCEECLNLLQDNNDAANVNGPSFVLDFPANVGVAQRALLTLPHGLMIGRSSIPRAGVGVINHGLVGCPGMHFGPYEGEATTCESAAASDFSWEVCKGETDYEYIDAARETHSNWMRYVRYARSKDEANLLAVQCKGSVFFHCCRGINPGDELMVWPSNKLLAHFSETWTQMWFMKLNSAESNSTDTSQIFLCSHCQLSFTTEAFLQRHIENFHAPPTEGSAAQVSQEAASENPTPNGESGTLVESLVLLSVDAGNSTTCGDCGKTFKQMRHLVRHKLCVHANERPYCCPTCRRTFSQASGLIRHEVVHRKQAAPDPPSQSKTVQEKRDDSTQISNLQTPDIESENQEVSVTDAEDGPAGETDLLQFNCSDCEKCFSNEATLKKHKLIVHEKLRPYVCSVCQRCFGQFNDLTRHLQVHGRESNSEDEVNEAPEEANTLLFICTECSLAFPSADTLQQHSKEHNSDKTALTNRDDEPVTVEDDQADDPDFIPQPSAKESVQNVPSQRPQRLGVRSRISAITKLIAPKRRRKEVSRKPLTEQSSTQLRTRATRNEKLRKYKWFSCEGCRQTYGNQDDLKAHKCALKQLKCGQCGAAFSKSGFLKRHEQKVHSTSKSYSCDHCSKVFTTSCNLKQHQKSKACKKYHCTSELFSCSFCQFSFTVKSYLLKHIKRHHPGEYRSLCDSDASVAERQEEEEEEDDDEEKKKKRGLQYVCPQCGKSYASTRAYNCHACLQQVKVLYLCTDCGKSFMSHYSLKQHQRIHTGEKPHSCPHCTKSFTYTCQLNVHLRTHTGEKPYLCTHCGESFRQSGDLKRHERKHTGVKPYPCPECGKSFSRPHSLKAHQMLHLGQRMFKCTECGKSFSRSYHLRRHHQKMHL